MSLNPWQRQLTDFHRATDSTVGTTPAIRDADLRMRLIAEETAELAESVQNDTLAEAIKELCDVLYVTIGTAVAWGIDLDPFFTAVHESNMSKLPLTKREDGKVLKGPNYRPADIAGLLADQVDAIAERRFTQPINPDPVTALAKNR